MTFDYNQSCAMLANCTADHWSACNQTLLAALRKTGVCPIGELPSSESLQPMLHPLIVFTVGFAIVSVLLLILLAPQGRRK